GEAVDGASAAFGPAVVVADAVDGHVADPTRRVVVPRDAAPPRVRADEAVLNGVGRHLLIPARHGQGAHHRPVVRGEDRVERGVSVHWSRYRCSGWTRLTGSAGLARRPSSAGGSDQSTSSAMSCKASGRVAATITVVTPASFQISSRSAMR